MIASRRRVSRVRHRVVVSSHALEPRTFLASTLAVDFTPGNLGSNPYDFVTLGDSTYFFTTNAVNAGPGVPILWKTDGTDAGTTMVKAFAPPPISSPIVPNRLTAATGHLYFVAFDGDGYRTWVSDGTPDGTRVLSPDLYGATEGAGTAAFIGVGDLAFFNGHTGVNSSDWTWVTDGTAQGTRQVPGLFRYGGSEVRNLASSGSRFYVTAATPAAGIGLYAADGTEGGTRLLRDFGNDGTTFLPTVDSLTDVGGTLYFVAAAAPGEGKELWKSDGTPEGTVLVKDIRPGAESSGPRWLTNVGGTLFFAAGGADGDALWRSDGTAAGTVEVLDRAPDSQVPLRPTQITAASGVALFAGSDSAHGAELWRTDGTAAGTFLVSDTNAGPGDGVNSVADLKVAQDKVFFTAIGDAAGARLWVTDGTATGTRPTPALVTDSVEYQIAGGGTVLGDRFVFSGGPAPQSPNPWVSDGTPEGTHRLTVVQPTPKSSRIEPLIPLGDDRVLVNTGDTLTLYAVDAANNAVPLLSPVLVSSRYEDGRSARASWASLGDVVVFAARPSRYADDPIQVYRTDGTPQGTYRLSDVDLEPPGFLGHEGAPTLVRVGDKVYFAAADAAHGVELWATDGTKEGTAMVRDIAPGRAGSMPPVLNYYDAPMMAPLGDKLFFRAMTNQLWETDGTEAGTKMVMDLGDAGAFGRFRRIGDRLFFTAYADGRRFALWTSDGTAAGTAPVPKAVSTGGQVMEMGGIAYFVGDEAGGGTAALFRSDGTADGTFALSGPRPLSPPREFAVVGGLLYFLSAGTLWRTDGTAAGTFALREGGSQYDIGSLQGVGDTLYFASRDLAHGSELWKSDGTVAGTVLAEDAWPGPTDSGASWLTGVGDTLYFAAADPQNGMELRRLDPPAQVVRRHVFYNHSGFDGGDAAAGAADDGAVAPDKQALFAGQPVTFDSVTSYSRGLNGVMIDLANLPQGEALTADDFDFGGATAPVSVTVRRGAGEGGSDRVTLIWRDYNPLDASPLPQAVANSWLTVTVKANGHTGLARPDVFSFGNLIGETGDGSGSSGWRVSALDLGATKRESNASATLASVTDVNRDGRTNALDLGVLKRSLNRSLSPFGDTTAVGTEVRAAAIPTPADNPSGRIRRIADDVLA